MNTTLAEFQTRFAQALFGTAPACGTADPMAGPEPWSQPAFAVYRNTVMKACLDALEANFPAVVRLVGREWFRAAAAIHVAATPPRHPLMLEHGAGLPDFLAGFKPAAGLPYLAQVARLDMLWRESHAAADAAPLRTSELARHAPDCWESLVLRLHPAARWAWFDDAPICSIWSCNRMPEGTSVPDFAWQGEGVVLTRSHDAVEWQPLDRAAFALVDACAAGQSIAAAADAAWSHDPQLDLAALLDRLLRAGTFTRIEPEPRP
ncbi:MAG: DUF2063 domain-containing protein [Comamonadaceae bacterium]|nr:MAG: DUF2063 domain-containing protein [Comamonadaceae bacterium]